MTTLSQLAGEYAIRSWTARKMEHIVDEPMDKRIRWVHTITRPYNLLSYRPGSGYPETLTWFAQLPPELFDRACEGLLFVCRNTFNPFVDGSLETIWDMEAQAFQSTVRRNNINHVSLSLSQSEAEIDVTEKLIRSYQIEQE
jgi:hypothetical protein